MARSLMISAETRKEWAVRLEHEITAAKEAREDHLEMVARSKAQYRNILPPKDRPWPGCANLSPPITTRAVEQVVQRSVMQFLQGREYIQLRPASAAMADRARKVEGYHRWQAEAELDYARKVDLMQRARTVCGTMFAGTSWCRKRRRVCDVIEIDRDILQPKREAPEGFAYVQGGDPQPRGAPIDRVLDELFGPHRMKWTAKKKVGRDKRRSLDYYEVLYTDERGREDTARITIDKSEELGDYAEVMAEVWRMVEDQPVIDIYSIENVVTTPGEYTVQTAPLVALRSFVNTDYIESMLDSGEWYLDGDEKAELLGRLYDADGQEKAQGEMYDGNDRLLADDDDYLGLDSMAGRDRMTAMFRIMTDWDIREDGELVAAEIIFLPRHHKIVRVHYDSVHNRSGMRNIVSSVFLPVENQLYGLPLPEFIRTVQEEANTIRNQRVDRNSVTANPTVFADPAVQWERDNAIVVPGAWIPVPDPQRNILIPNFPSHAGEDMALSQELDLYAQDMLGGFGPLSAGRSEGTNNSNRTWRGAQLLVAQTSRATEYQAEMMRGAVIMLWKQIYAWNAANIPKGKEFRILGTDEVEAFETREDFRGDYDFVFDVDSAIVNSEIERFLWSEYFQLAGQVMAAPPESLQPGLIKYCIEMGKRRRIPNPQQFFGNPPNLDRDPMTPEQEHQLFMAGQPVQTHPMDDIQQHLMGHAAFAQRLMDPDDMAIVPPAGKQFFMKHFEETIRQWQMLRKNAGSGLGPMLDMAQNPAMNGQPGGPPGPQPPAVAGPEGPNQGPGVEMLNAL